MTVLQFCGNEQTYHAERVAELHLDLERCAKRSIGKSDVEYPSRLLYTYPVYTDSLPKVYSYNPQYLFRVLPPLFAVPHIPRMRQYIISTKVRII